MSDNPGHCVYEAEISHQGYGPQRGSHYDHQFNSLVGAFTLGPSSHRGHQDCRPPGLHLYPKGVALTPPGL